MSPKLFYSSFLSTFSPLLGFQVVSLLFSGGRRRPQCGRPETPVFLFFSLPLSSLSVFLFSAVG